jgi:hypothetical protein
MVENYFWPKFAQKMPSPDATLLQPRDQTMIHNLIHRFCGQFAEGFRG